MAAASSVASSLPSSAQPDHAFTDDERQKLDAVLVLLRDAEHPQLQALHRKADTIANPSPEVQAMAKMNAAVVELQKADTTLTRSAALEKARRENPGLERELHPRRSTATRSRHSTLGSRRCECRWSFTGRCRSRGGGGSASSPSPDCSATTA